MRPAVRDKLSTETAHEQSRVPYPNAASHSHVSSFLSPNLKMNASKGLVPTNAIAKTEERQLVKAAVSKNAMSVEQHSPSR